MQSFRKEIENGFSFLAGLGFIISFPRSAVIGEPIAIFTCPSFQMRLLQYHQELYLEFSKTTLKAGLSDDGWIAFHWLISYISGNDKHETNFFENETNYNDRIKKQILSLSEELQVFINGIITFFNSNDYEKQYVRLKNYISQCLKDRGLL